jgi:hypothetical protein
MKFHRLVTALFILTSTLVLQSASTSLADDGATRKVRAYSARLISPQPGAVLSPGQQVQIRWDATLPNVEMTWCEVELYLSLDGGQTFSTRLTPQLDPRIGYYNWTVPNTPSGAAVLDIRFGCEGYYPETASAQPQSTFVIARTNRVVPTVAIESVSTAQASPGDTVQVAWTSTVPNVDHFELQVSYDRGAHFSALAQTKEQQFAWGVPADFAGHATFRVIAHTISGGQVESTISAEPQAVVRARSN